MRIKAVVFDYNGVLIDDLGIHIECYLDVLAKHGVAITEKQIWAVIAKTALDKIGQFLPPEKKHLAAQLAKEKVELYEQKVKGKNLLFPNELEIVERLSNHYWLGIITHSNRTQLNAAFPPNLRGFFTKIITAEKMAKKKAFLYR